MTTPLEPALAAAATEARAWPFEEARRLIKRLEKLKGGADKTVIFETGYGPSGLPHIGTFGEVARTSMVRHAFEVLTEGKRKTRLICFSDDMDGLRKVPDNVPNQDMLARASRQAADLGARPVRQEYRELRRTTTTRCCARFLDRFGFDYEFISATECYKAGRVRRDAAADARGLRQGDGHHPADAGAGAARDLFAVPADLAHARARCCRCRWSSATRRRARSSTSIPTPARRSRRSVTGGARQVPVEGRLGHALDRARRRLRDGRQGPDRLGHAVVEDLQGARRHAARGLQLRAVPRRQGREDLQVEGQRPDHRRVADATPRPRACRCSCSRSRRRPSGSTST